jgi:hypothetical protein
LTIHVLEPGLPPAREKQGKQSIYIAMKPRITDIAATRNWVHGMKNSLDTNVIQDQFHGIAGLIHWLN